MHILLSQIFTVFGVLYPTFDRQDYAFFYLVKYCFIIGTGHDWYLPGKSIDLGSDLYCMYYLIFFNILEIKSSFCK